MTRVLALGPGVLLPLLAAMVGWLTASGLGFPDGHLTDWERAARPLIQGYVVACALVAAGTGGAVWTGRTRVAWALGVGFVLGSLALYVGAGVLLAGLDHGQGG